MAFTKEHFSIPKDGRDQHLPMVPRYAAPFKKKGIRGVGFHEMKPPYEICRLSFPWHLVIISISGNAEFEFKGKKGVIEPGQVWVGPAKTPYRYAALDDWKFISAALFPSDEFLHLEGDLLHQTLSQSAKPLVHAIEAYFQESVATKGPGSTAPIGLATYISEAIVRELGTEQNRSTCRLRLSLMQVWEEVNANPGIKWQLPSLARKMSVSVRQFQRIMKENYDLTAEKMLMRIRMEHARELLGSTDLTMIMIAERIGYNCVFAFSKGFKRYLGIPPGAYRKAINSGDSTDEVV
jgi:AraC-like DNA-binding protein